ncbi:MAG: zinc ribbon domain-containing protein [Cyanobacteria bacterium J06614_10]
MVDPTPTVRNFKGSLNPHQSLYLSNQGKLTTVTVVSSSLGEQHNRLLFSTGPWTATPLLYPISETLVVVIVITGDAHAFFQISGTQVQMSHQLQDDALIAQLKTMTPIAMTPTPSVPQPPAPPTPPEQTPANPDSQTDQTLPQSTADNRRQFCTQCGSAVRPEDKFCAYCGHQLT